MKGERQREAVKGGEAGARRAWVKATTTASQAELRGCRVQVSRTYEGLISITHSS